MKQNPKTKDMLFKDLSPNEIKTIVSGFYLKSYNNLLIMHKLYMTYISSYNNKRTYFNY